MSPTTRMVTTLSGTGVGSGAASGVSAGTGSGVGAGSAARGRAVAAGGGVGYRLTAVVATAFCLVAGLVFTRYRERDVLSAISSHEGGQR